MHYQSTSYINGTDLCFGCGGCAMHCPKNVIKMKRDDEGFSYPNIDFEHCIKCGKCKKSCPVNTAESFHPSRTTPQLFVARHTDDLARKKSASGGVFRAISEDIIARGGAIVGAAFNEKLQLKMVLSSDPKVRDACCSSKYVQAEMGDIYKEVANFLKENRPLLFSGAPCQVAGLYAFLGKDYPQLLTMDFICHGVPSPKVFQAYIDYLEKQYSSKAISISFRDKRIGWTPMLLSIQFENGCEYTSIHEKDPYFLMFLEGKISRPSCYKCPYARFENRIGDFTVGDAWRAGQQITQWEDNQGISSLLIQTQKAYDFFYAPNKLLKEACELPIVDQRYLHAPIKKHIDRNALFRAFKKHGIEYIMHHYTGKRPFLRRLKTRLLKICHIIND